MFNVKNAAYFSVSGPSIRPRTVHVRLQVPEKLLAVTWLKEVEERDKETGRIHQKKTALTKALFISDLRYIGRNIACPVY